MSLNCDLQARIGEEDPGHFRETLARLWFQLVFPGLEEYVAHICDQATGSVMCFKYSTELLQKPGTKICFFFFSLLAQLVRLLCGGAGFVSFYSELLLLR